MRVFLRDNWQCQHCGRLCDGVKEAQCDHIRPKAQGGQDREDELQTLCIRCHAKKTNSERMINKASSS